MRFYALAIVVLVLISLAGCSGKGTLKPAMSAVPTLAGTDGPLRNEYAPVTVTKDGFTLTVLAESFSLGGKADFSLEISAIQDVTEIAVHVQADGLKACYLTLAYDAQKLHPVASTADEWPGVDADRLLSLTVLDTPGAVHHGSITAHPQAADGVSGSFKPLTLQFAAGAAASAKSVSAAPLSPESRCPLTLYAHTGSLGWRYYNSGDYDQNGEVNISDLTPLGLKFGAVGPFDYWDLESVIDGDSNGEINIADVTTIGANFGNLIASFNVYESLNPAADYPATAGAPSTITPIGNISMAEFDTSPDSRGSFNYWLTTAPIAGSVYWVRPTDGTAEGIASNRTDEPNGVDNQQPVMFFTTDVSEGDAPLTVTFDASASYDPDGDPLTAYQANGWCGEGPSGARFITPESASASFQYTITEYGNYQVQIHAHDSVGGSESAPQFIIVRDNGNTVPSADLVIEEPRNGDAPHSVTLSMAGSIDADGDALTYEFDVVNQYLASTVLLPGDFEINNGSNPVYEYTAVEPGYYDFYGRATDTCGLSEVAYAGQITVLDNGNYVPRISFSVDPYSGAAPLTVHFHVYSGSVKDKDGEVVLVEIDPEGTQTWEPFDLEQGRDYIYNTPGQYYPRMRATDNGGATGYSSASITITVTS